MSQPVNKSVPAGVTVVVGFAESLSAPEVVWSLVDHGYKVAAFTRRGRNNPLKKSRFVTVFEITAPEEKLEQAMVDLARETSGLKTQSQGTVAVLPLDDVAALLCGRAKLDPEILVIGPVKEQLTLALDKERQITLAAECGFNVPKTSFVTQTPEVVSNVINYPVIFKSALAVEQTVSGVTKGKGWICADRSELEAAVNQWSGQGPMILQEFIAGTGEGIFGLMTAAGVVGWSGHRRLRMMNPHGSGASACISTSGPDLALQKIAHSFLSSVGWRGLFMIELLRDQSGKLWFIEFNGRAWGSMALARHGGFEYPAWSVQQALSPGDVINAPTPQKDLVCRHLGRELLHMLFVLRGSKSKALAEWPSFWKTCLQMFRFGRGDHWYNWRNDDRKVFYSDLVLTLRSQLLKSKV